MSHIKRGLAVLAVLVAPGSVSAGDWKFNSDLSLSNKAADFHVDLKGYVQFDFRHFGDEFNLVPPANLNATSDTPRRLRIELEGEWKKLGFRIEMDPHDTCWIWDNPCTAGNPEHMKDAHLEYNFSKAFVLRAGNLKLPISHELLTSESKVDFVERAMAPSRLGPNRDWGLEAYGDLNNKKWGYIVGVFAGDGRVDVERAGTTGAARLLFYPTKGLEIAASYTQGTVTAEPLTANNNSPNPMSPSGKGPSGYSFFPRHFVQGHRIRYGGDATYYAGPFGFKAEYMGNHEQRLGQGQTCTPSGSTYVCNDLPDLLGQGWVVGATWLLTGDKKTRTIKPQKPLFSGPGAIELAARFEYLKFDDTAANVGFESQASRATNVLATGNHVFTGGVSWWPTQFFRATGNVAVEKFTAPVIAPTPGKAGNYVTLIGRLQLMIP
jgi:phosphate-selective porin